MSDKGFADDASALLYLVPFAASGAYGLFLWVQAGISVFLPSVVFLAVTRDPILFVVGSVAVMLGVVLEVRSTEPLDRPARLASLSNTLQSMAAASLILVIVAALYANGFSDVSGAATDVIVGRYGLVFPALLVLLSYLVTAQFKLQSMRNPKVLGILAMLLVPVSIYEIGKRQIVLGLSIALLLLAAGIAAFVLTGRKESPDKEL